MLPHLGLVRLHTGSSWAGPSQRPLPHLGLGASGDLKPLLARLARVVELGSSDQAT